jgi:hypothetical protein
MKTTHTPGPWGRNIKPATKYPVIFAGRNTHVAMVDTRLPADEVEANIRLIAAAPDLLAALRDAKVELEQMHAHYCKGCPGGCPTLEYIENAARAIAKAEGTHTKVLHGECKVCGHFGEDCTGTEAES